LPDERVTAMVEHLSPHTRAAWARLETVDAPSPARRPPACRAFGACGGCVLQHLDYDAQRTWKRARVARALAAIDVAVDACVASPRPLGYRNRSKLVVARNGGRLVLGAYAPRSHDVVDTAGCRIAEPPLDDTATALAALLDQAGVAAYDERTLVGHLRHVVLRASHDGRVLATWVTTRPLPDGPALASAFRAARPEVVGVVEHVNRGRGNANLRSLRERRPRAGRPGDDRGSRGPGRPASGCPAAPLGRRVLPGQPRRGRAGLRRDRGRAGGPPG
jgi:tRNA/tmRNA/rRNA uracil-C5-methylase (TrmA/RlmC/RlmD family)